MANFADRIKNFFGIHAALSRETCDELADLLVEGDFGAQEAFDTVDRLEALAKKEKITDAAALREKLAAILEQELMISGGVFEADSLWPSDAMTAVLLLGVNGVGKTTTAAKLAYMAAGAGRKPILAAADTFRAAAIDQLKIHGDRLGCRVVAHQHGGDPAAVVYDAMDAAQAAGGVIIADTAGRMHTKAALVEELKKIGRVLQRGASAGAAPVVTKKILVLDATTGRNAIAQAEVFNEAVKLDGCILTKYDSSAKGGVVFSLASQLKLPVLFLCDGERYGDIRPFDGKIYVREFLGLAD